MAKCLRCRKEIGCTCNRRTAHDGTACCIHCIGEYIKQNPVQKPAPGSKHAPTNVTVMYKGPGVQLSK
jgi:hypothetical protein